MNIGFLCITMQIYTVLCPLSQIFERLLLNNMHCYHYYNVSERPRHIILLK